MYNNKNFSIKLIFPCKFEFEKTLLYRPLYYLPYGMGIVTAFLRKNSYYVEQEDLAIRFNRYDKLLFERLKNKKIDLEASRHRETINDFIKFGEIRGQIDLFMDNILDSISIEGFDLIGFSILSGDHFLFALMLSKKIKQRTNTPIVFGGPFIDLFGNLYPKAFELIDYIIIGDGRIPLLRLIEYLKKTTPISKVPNLIYKNDEKIITNPKEKYPIEDMPVPDFSDLPLELYKNKYAEISGYDILFFYQTSGGCIYRCSFCIHRHMYEKPEFKSYEKVISELIQIQERYNSKMLYFCDSAINNSYEYLEGLCDLFIKNNLNLHWIALANVANLNKHILRKMKEAGCDWIIFGIESGSDRMLKLMNKGFSSEQASKVIREASELNIKTMPHFIAGFPHETQHDINQTFEFLRKNKKFINYIRVYVFSLFYGSPIYFNPERYGVENLRPTPSRFCFAFDEINGLKWEQKQKQQQNSQRQIEKTIPKYNKFKNFITHCLNYLN